MLTPLRILALTLICGLAACGGGSGKKGPDLDPDPNPQPTPIQHPIISVL